MHEKLFHLQKKKNQNRSPAIPSFSQQLLSLLPFALYTFLVPQFSNKSTKSYTTLPHPQFNSQVKDKTRPTYQIRVYRGKQPSNISWRIRNKFLTRLLRLICRSNRHAQAVRATSKLTIALTVILDLAQPKPLGIKL